MSSLADDRPLYVSGCLAVWLCVCVKFVCLCVCARARAHARAREQL
jgi:hypothetical protein